MADPAHEKEVDAAAAGPVLPTGAPSPRSASPSAGKEASAEKETLHGGDQGQGQDQDEIRRVKTAEEGGDNGSRQAELDRLRTVGTATSLASTTAVTTNQLPEQKPWYKQPNPLRWGKIPPVPKEKEVCPEHTAGFFNSLVFQWIAPLMNRGYKRPLEFNDIYSVNPDRAVDPMTDKLRAVFKRRLDGGDKFPLMWAINETFFWEFWVGGACALLSSVMQVMSPFVLRYLIQFAADAYIASMRGLPAPNIGHGIGLVVGITAMQIVQSLATNHFLYRGMLVGGMTRAALISLIYEKSMVISGRAKAGGAELPDIPAARAAEKQRKKDAAKKAKKTKGAGPAGGQTALSGDGVGWDNGRIVSWTTLFSPLDDTHHAN